MVLGRVPRARRIQEVCIFCALHAEANLFRTSRRLHIGRSNREAAEATTQQKVEESNTIDSLPSRYSGNNAASKSATLADGKHFENSLYGARYTSKEAASWKKQDVTRTESKQSSSNPVTTQNDNQDLPLSRPFKIQSYFARNDGKSPTPKVPISSRHAGNQDVRLSPTDTGGGQPAGHQRSSRQERSEDQELSSSLPNRQTRRPEWRQGSASFSLKPMLERSNREWSQQSQAQHVESVNENTNIPARSGKLAMDSSPLSQAQPREDNARRDQLAPRVEAAVKADASDGAIPRFRPLEKSPAPRPRRLPSRANTETVEFAKTSRASISVNLASPESSVSPEHEASEFVGFQSNHESQQGYIPKLYDPKPAAIPKTVSESSTTDSETPSRFKERRRSISWEEEDVRNDGKRSKIKKAKPARRRNEDEDDDDIDPQKLDKIEERQRRKAAAKAAREDRASGQSFIVPSFISIGNLATALKIRAESFGEVLRRQGFEKLSNDHVLDAETAGLIATELGFKAVLPVKDSEIDIIAQPAPESTDLLPPRPPVVTIMGHVDHGKTTLLDWLRNSSIAASEHGGITQHIGAFTVQMPSGRIITFLDTPGHAAFLEMRARGANVTDIVILVVAADDSVKPQTIEAIKHAKAAHTQIVVAISKIDKPEADAERVKQDLARHGIEVEDYGGDTQTVCVSGKTGQGMDQLEDAIIALADVLDVKADPTGSVEGWVLEGARKSLGKTATVLIRRGTMKAGQIVVAGHTWARIRNLRNEAGVSIEEGLPGTPVEIDGWYEQPEAGAEVLQAPNEQRARRVVDYRISKAEIEKQAAEVAAVNEARRLHDRQRELEKDRVALLGKKAAKLQTTLEPKKSGLTEVPIIIRADVSGSAEAINDSVLSLGNSEVRAKVIRTAVGRVSESDIELAVAAEGYIVNFNLELDSEILRLADRAGIRIVDGSIIYKVMDDVKTVLEDKLPPRLTHHVTGEADVLQTFDINLKGKKTLPVAGCRVTNGLMAKGSQVKVTRGEDIIYDGLLSTLKHLKKDVTEIRKGSECGISFDNFSDFAPGDQIQCYDVKSEKRHL